MTITKCAGCNHSFNFHRKGRSHCTVKNCPCAKWERVLDEQQS